MRASDDGKSFHRYHEIYHLKVPPGTSSGDNLHCSRWGNAGPDGSCGDLICAVRVVADAPRSPRKGAPKARVEKGARSTRESRPEILPLAISLSEAVLGGRVQVTASDSVVMVTIPPLSSGGRRLRLKGKGRRGGDLFLELRVVMPTELDDESRSLMEQFAALNPYDPRGD
jgi:DnaJ-class molecular chaperone